MICSPTPRHFTYQCPDNVKGKEKIRICKDFYLSTLSADAKRIINTHKLKNSTTVTVALHCRGKHVKKPCKHYRPRIRAHIEPVPKTESHYCRRNTNREYFSENMNMQILYEQYVAQSEASDTQPAKKHLYREAFNTEYNTEFNKPKKDRCDICEAGKLISCVLCFDMQSLRTATSKCVKLFTNGNWTFIMLLATVL